MKKYTLVLAAFLSLITGYLSAGRAFAAEISKENNTQTERLVFDRKTCRTASPFLKFNDIYIKNSGNPEPEVCTAFIVGPQTTHPNPQSIGQISSSAVDLGYLLKAAPANGIAAVAVYFYAPPFDVAEFSLNIPMDVNAVWADLKGNTRSAPSFVRSVGNVDKVKNMEQISLIYMYTKDGGKNWQSTFICRFCGKS
ncbi:hypothetical protein LOC54_04630 [Acetobacter sp. AN02]|uniref:hypothetical protein n=1 Tax=Acetobacter sp. AN02 TaxID=2894186 RepID=UPI0024345D4D|nr:hypothetical protein [Acetobacter sp. AN02]MDG6094404.1 hypothetical protein [Acetobacter sp. AN02]